MSRERHQLELLERAAGSAAGKTIIIRDHVMQGLLQERRALPPELLMQVLDEQQWQRSIGRIEHSVPYRGSILSVR